MSQTLQLTTAGANLLIANSANLRLYYDSPKPAQTDVLIAQGAAVTPFINAGGRSLQSLPFGAGLNQNQRCYRLQIPAAQGFSQISGWPRDIELGENLECTAADPFALLASGLFTTFTPTTSQTIPTIYG